MSMKLIKISASLIITYIIIYSTLVTYVEGYYADPVAYTREKYRPLIGGIQIENIKWFLFIPTLDELCTLGYIAKDGSGRLGVVTAGHCYNFETGWGWSAYQPNYDFPLGTNYIGGPSIMGTSLIDVTFIPYSNVTSRVLHIVNESGEYLAENAPVTGIVDRSWLDWCTQVQGNDPVCEYIYKTGRTTGTTRGRCFYYDSVSGRIIIQNLYAWSGDSGSPAYIIPPSRSFMLYLAGIVVAVSTDPSGSQYAGLTYAVYVGNITEVLGVQPVIGG